MTDAVGVDGADDSPFDEAFLRSLGELRLAVRRMRARQGEGLRRPNQRGGRIEFASHRAYSPGDDPRHLDWPAFARTGRLFVKEFEREEDSSLSIVVDVSASMGLHGKLRAASRLAYALSYVALFSNARVRVATCSGAAVQWSATVSGSPRLREIGGFLARAKTGGETDLDGALAAVRPERGGGVFVLISDLLAERDGRRALTALAGRNVDVHVLHLSAAPDRDGPRRSDAILIDAESGERMLAPADAADRAVAHAQQTEEAWGVWARTHRASYLTLDPALPTDVLVLDWLRGSGVLA